MKNRLLLLAGIAILLVLISSCASEDTAVQPPSWKGFNYIVKKAVADGKPGDTEEIERGNLVPGDQIKIYAVRKSKGKKIGEIRGDIYVRTTLLPAVGAPVIEEYSKPVVSLANSSLDGWEDPYITYDLPAYEGEYRHYKVEVACRFYFRAFGNENSEVDLSDRTSHEEPYIGNIYTNYDTFSPLNGGDAATGMGTTLEYQTLYED